ncbi:dihydrolipoamide acetyltransferase family protein [Pseudogulbenkiania sp. MAI-1]|uniref:dihydrolipoamide acetyltransferase family protein n=1 Tax=Pseudogulbenkiania sp. MAI-1 TaxID=990370 RepID=UPI00045E91CA|nr:dihydrolipoamide acetyltransferase family protein [Pseudogulbenkiania sp. MAI-1]
MVTTLETDRPATKSLPLTGLRGAIARNMSQGWQAPRVAMWAEVDVTACQLKRARLLAEQPGLKLTLTAFVLRALALTLREHPHLNALMRDKEVELVDDINLALAVSVPGGLMAPVIRQADTMSVLELAAESRRLAEGARSGSLGAGAFQRGTFTVTNLGMTAIDGFSPVINPPQVAILGVSRVIDKPVVRHGAIVPAPLMGLSLVFDHRAVDGYPAALFLGDLKRRLESAEEL